MPRVRRKKLALKRDLPPTILVAKFFLIKIGSLPLYVVYGLWFVVKTLFSIQLPTLNRGRGRPRKKPLLYFYNSIPRPLRVITVLSLIILAFTSYTIFTFQTAYQLPNPERLVTPTQPLTTEFYDRNGTLLYRMYEGRNRTLIPLSEIPQHLINATIAIEDKNFYAHIGVNPLAIARAAVTNYKTGSQEGASTITQQVIKNSLLTPEKTYTRKIKEIVLAVWAERLYTKAQILQMYFNEAPLGGPFWGFEAAARGYFGKSVRDLSLAEAAYLAGLPASPTEFSPYGSHPELAKDRQKQVLRRMVEDKYITQAAADEAEKEELDLKPPTNDIKAAHLVMHTKDLLSQRYGARVVSQGGLKITTTVDLGLQEEVEKIVKNEVVSLRGLNVTNGAAMVTDAKTGQILAMVGSYDYHAQGYGNYNVTTSLRQPGSSIKPVTYATAFKKGFSPGNTVLDTPVVFRDEWGNSYSPVNYDGSFHGPVSIRRALGSSRNIPAVKLLASVGVPEMIQTARDLGITTFTDTKNYGLSITLGAADTKMVDMMGAYGTFAQGGLKRPVTSILKVTDSNGNVLEEFEEKSEQAISPQIAYLITHILSDNEARKSAFGPNSLLHIPPYMVAVKTGTSDDKKDNSTYGYTENFVVGAWVGNNNNALMSQQLASGVTGAAPIWNKIMKGILAKHPSSQFTRPPGIVEVMVDGRRDLAVADNLPKSLVQTKKEQDKTTYFDSFSAYATSSAQAVIKNGDTN